jgi:hypothetical protein
LSVLTWDDTGKRFFETGVDHGVLFIPDVNGVYDNGYAWNGLVSVTESPSGAESTPQYADNIKYLNLVSAEQFGATLEAFTYPDEFGQCDGTETPEPGVQVGQQGRKTFGLCYRTRVGNDLDGELGYKLHLIYNATAAPSEKAYTTVNDSPEAITFSWEISTTGAPGSGYKPLSSLTIDSTKVDAAALATLEEFLYGTVSLDPSLPTPDAVLAIFSGTITVATPTEPSFNSGTNTITIPSVTGVVYKRTDTGVAVTGTQVIAADRVIRAYPLVGYKFPTVGVDRWLYEYTP